MQIPGRKRAPARRVRASFGNQGVVGCRAARRQTPARDDGCAVLALLFTWRGPPMARSRPLVSG
jgi:hypothetical protein